MVSDKQFSVLGRSWFTFVVADTSRFEDFQADDSRKRRIVRAQQGGIMSVYI